ncbi:uncharacterized protein BJ212DRAFT_898117 [Suillus subaureus]|uniref:Uncharacterized protein n=1 Tax=Suillus subaureus TaxID=48587 RepID=A0A9P7J609_9AGAM|nr:uncharacterized protein BJ212DRAFT_898117 [Suillus subaureus]KAG1804422.1 hypothetical protein BJ212DRAFT_898117 [Suillus subaureus]
MVKPILPKPSQRTIERNWSPGTLCTVPNSTNLCVLMDPAQNLIAVVYFDDETLFINLRALVDDSFHPQAAGPILFLSELPGYDNDVDSESVKLKVMGRHIALQLAASNCDTWQLQIWDWQRSTTSDNVLSGDHPYEVDFCFLRNDRLLVVADNLKLYSIEDMSKTPELLASFVLPVQLPGMTACLLPVDSITCSSQPQMQVQQTMYTPDPKHRLLCITMYTYVSSIVYIISTRIFFDLPEIAVATPIPWKCWGPSNTRIFRCPPEHDECRVHHNGNRVLLLLRVHNSKRKPVWNRKYELCIMDFSPLAVRNSRGLGQVVTKPSTLNVADLNCKRNSCEERLTTFLPYVKVVLNRRFGLDDLKNIWMDKDRIYLLSDKLEVIDV